MNIIFISVIMKNGGLHLMIIAICAGASVSEYFFQKKRSLPHPSEFYLVKEHKDIQLYERWFELESGEATREIKAVYSVNTSIEAAITLIKNEEKAQYWNKGTFSFKILPIKENKWISYIQYKLPWPFDNQDCVLQHTVKSLSENYVIIEFENIEHKSFPPFEQVQRLNYIRGRWILKKVDSHIQVEYYISTIPSIVIPRHFTDPLIRNNLFATLTRFRKILG